MLTKHVLLVVLISFGCLFNASAQRLGFTYQAVAIDESKSQSFGRDSRGEILANKDIALQFSLLEGSNAGATVYQETHNTTTDIFGIFRLIIGRGDILFGNNLEALDWGEVAYFLQVEIDLGEGFVLMGIEELLGSPYALNNNIQLLELNGNALSISKGNTINLEDNDATNELVQSITLNGTNLEISDAGGNKSVDLASLVGLDNSTTNEIQDITTNGSPGNISLTDGSSLTLNVEDGDTDATNEMQTIAKAGSTVTLSNSGGSFTDEVNDADSDPANEIQNISTNGTAGNIALSSGATLALNVNDADFDNANELQTIAKAGSTVTLSNSGGSFTDEVNDADSDPANEIQDISTNGTAGNIALSSGATLALNVNDADFDPLNEIQNISTYGTAGNIALSSGATLALNVNDADFDNTNELQTITKAGSTVTLSNSGGSFTDEVNDADSDPANEIQDISTDGTAGDLSLSNGSTLSLNVNDADSDPINEIQNISTDGTAGNIALSSGATLGLNVNDADFDPTNEIELPATATINQVIKWDGTNWVAGADEVNDTDFDNTNELQTIAKAGSTVTLSNSGGSFTDEVNDADSDPINEIQNISTNGTAGNIALSSGATLALNVNDADSDPNNEIELPATATVNQVIKWDGTNWVAGADEVNDADFDPANEIQDISTDGTAGDLSLSSGSSLSLNVNDADFDPINEIQNISTDGTAGNIALSSGATLGLNVNDADFDITNELQTIAKTGSTVTLSNSGGSFTDEVNDADSDPINEIQDISTDGTAGDLSLSSGSSLSLNVNDADFDPLNEIQNISTDGTAGNIALSSGATLALNVNDADSDPNNEIELPATATVNQVIKWDGTNWVAGADDAAFNTTTNVTSNAPGDYTTDDFVFGSPQLDDNGNTNNDFRMFFDKSKGAFRAGQAIGTEWDDVNRGLSSVAMGVNTTASGDRSTAMGNSTNALGTNSTAIGVSTAALGLGSTAMGWSTDALGDYSTSMGFGTTASGRHSTSMGFNTFARSYAETTVGVHSTDYTPSSATTFNSADRLFVVGNGVSPPLSSDALIIYKSGNAILNGLLTIDGDNAGAGAAYTLPAQDGTANQVMTTDGAGGLSWVASTGGAFATATNVTSNAQGDFGTDDFVFGSPQLDDNGNTNSDYRMFFDKSKGAFRAGNVTNTQWDDANRGGWSVAMGFNTTASGEASTAMGEFTSASGITSTAMGRITDASGAVSTAMGQNTIASGSVSTAMGINTSAFGDVSTAMGYSTFARSYTETSLGSYNTDYVPNSTLVFNSADRLFVIGNGVTSLTRSDAFIIYKSGNAILNGLLTLDGDNAGVGAAYTLPAQDGTANQIMTTDGAGGLSWVADTGGAFTTTTNVTSNAPGDYTTDDFVFGSPQLDDNGNTNNDFRMFFDKSKGAFRAGIATGTEWDDANRGIYSVAMGRSTIASGARSTAMGSSTSSSGSISTAMGSGTSASGDFSTAMGDRTNASGNHSTTMGFLTNASGWISTAMGLQTFARSFGETTIGLYSTDYTPISTIFSATTDRLFVVGNGSNLSNRSDALIIYKNGNATLAGMLTQSSDARLKQEVAPLTKSLEKVAQLQGVHYKWNAVKPHDMESLQTGLIAQEVEKILPELVKESSDGYKSVNYIGLIPHLIEAIKELKAENDTLQQESDEKVKSLEERLLRLEKLIEGK